jgi:hypothetical protein
VVVCSNDVWAPWRVALGRPDAAGFRVDALDVRTAAAPGMLPIRSPGRLEQAYSRWRLGGGDFHQSQLGE